MKVTVAQFAEQQGINTIEAGGVLKFLARNGFATESKIETGAKGRPASVFKMRRNGTLTIKSA